MPPPTPLAIATSSLLRLLKEESSYHAELATQESRAQKLQASLEHPDRNGAGEDGEDADGNAEWRLKQEVRLPAFSLWGVFSCAALLWDALGCSSVVVGGGREVGEGGMDAG